VLKEILKLDWLLETDTDQRSAIEQGFLFLARFQPGIGEQPIDIEFHPDGTVAGLSHGPDSHLKQVWKFIDETTVLTAEFGSFKTTERRGRAA
jgi:hypothetical protein